MTDNMNDYKRQEELLSEKFKAFDDITSDESFKETMIENITQGKVTAKPTKKKSHKKAWIAVAASFLIIACGGLMFKDVIRYQIITTLNDYGTVGSSKSSVKSNGSLASGNSKLSWGDDSLDWSVDSPTNVAEEPPERDKSATFEARTETTNSTENSNIEAGTLTAAEVNDNQKWDEFLKTLREDDQFFNAVGVFGMYPQNRRKVIVTKDDAPVENASVVGKSSSGNVIWNAKTDNNGVAYLFSGFFNKDNQDSISVVEVTKDGETVTDKISGDETTIKMTSASAKSETKALDLMLVTDTTGSMDDELRYLQKELESVINTIRTDNSGVKIRLSVNFYRDVDDDYVVKPFEFTSDIDKAIGDLNAQSASGGGDFPEAVEQALNNAIKEHDWSENATAKIMILVLDAPPHTGDAVNSSLKSMVEEASKQGIRIVPVAGSGTDKSTEAFLRSLSISTGGTYTFLTDDSGVGDSHMEASAKDYKVEPLNTCLVRIINSYLK